MQSSSTQLIGTHEARHCLGKSAIIQQGDDSPGNKHYTLRHSNVVGSAFIIYCELSLFSAVEVHNSTASRRSSCHSCHYGSSCPLTTAVLLHLDCLSRAVHACRHNAFHILCCRSQLSRIPATLFASRHVFLLPNPQMDNKVIWNCPKSIWLDDRVALFNYLLCSSKICSPDNERISHSRPWTEFQVTFCTRTPL